ncbi:MAG: histidine phosphatase family protein, partial [Planctomycetaceae bacterium]|nr:histidine phosphatase family protein [Planctomycetaceae bacterium]
MKTLFLMRHAKSSWKDESLPDHDRPLNKRGKRDAPRMGQLLLEQGVHPDRWLSSTALRARRTAELLAETLQFAGEIEFRSELYHAEPEQFLSVIR